MMVVGACDSACFSAARLDRDAVFAQTPTPPGRSAAELASTQLHENFERKSSGPPLGGRHATYWVFVATNTIDIGRWPVAGDC